MFIIKRGLFHVNKFNLSQLYTFSTKNNNLGLIVETSQVNSIVTTPEYGSSIKVLDCTYTAGAKPDPEKFIKEEYGKFDLLMKKESAHHQMYLDAHLPKAIFFDLNCAMFPGDHERFSFYPSDKIEEYMQILGINKGDHLILYGRGIYGGNMFAARCLRLLQLYGMKNMSLMNGGLPKWVNDKYEISTGEETPLKRGNWEARPIENKMLITYDELIAKDKEGKSLFDKAGEDVTFLDSRPHEQFIASFIEGSNNLPISKLLNENGTIASRKTILEVLKKYKVDVTKPIISYCNTGTQASLASLIFESVLGIKTRLYNGSLSELSDRSPERITSF
uniref:Rhodanese domain-containing protein n=1 Tax=Parastrongyloides trichosuri TaxID=131310 RepID=A0A0N4ZL63_PARTI